VTIPRNFYDGAWHQRFRKSPARRRVSTEADTSGARHRAVGRVASSRLAKPLRRGARNPGMRLILLALPLILTVLMLVACGGKGGGGY
jgi:hypothetical protein